MRHTLWTVVSTRRLAGGFSHETSLVKLAGGQVVARLGGSDPEIEAAVMAAAHAHVPVPEVLLVMPSADRARQGMVLEHVTGTPLSDVLAGNELGSVSPDLPTATPPTWPGSATRIRRWVAEGVPAGQ